MNLNHFTLSPVNQYKAREAFMQMGQPFRKDGILYASDGRIAIRPVDQGQVEDEYDGGPNVNGSIGDFSHASIGPWVPVQALVERHTPIDCDICDDAGYVMTRMETAQEVYSLQIGWMKNHTLLIPDVNGIHALRCTNAACKNAHVDYEHHRIAWGYVALLASQITECELMINVPELAPIPFRGKEGVGYLMGMRK